MTSLTTCALKCCILSCPTVFTCARFVGVPKFLKKLLGSDTWPVRIGPRRGSILHLVDHAFFKIKALLFLGAGSVIHALSNEEEMGKITAEWGTDVIVQGGLVSRRR
jgi:hypothetical protein